MGFFGRHLGKKSQTIGESQPGGAIRNLNMAGRDYPMFGSLRETGVAVKENRRCAYITSFARFGDDYREINRAVGKAVNYETELEIRCCACQLALSSEGVGFLYFIHAPNIVGMGGIGGASANQQMQALREGKCPRCGEDKCFYIFDPSGFAS
jgi:hypothetical protein